jgi:hypothetical protein
VFDNKYAECLILRTDGGEAVGLALVSCQVQPSVMNLTSSTSSTTLHGLELLVYT